MGGVWGVHPRQRRPPVTEIQNKEKKGAARHGVGAASRRWGMRCWGDNALMGDAPGLSVMGLNAECHRCIFHSHYHGLANRTRMRIRKKIQHRTELPAHQMGHSHPYTPQEKRLRGNRVGVVLLCSWCHPGLMVVGHLWRRQGVIFTSFEPLRHGFFGLSGTKTACTGWL